jgi:hypothetical protein
MSICFMTVPVLLDTATYAAHLQKQWERLFHYGHIIMPSIAVGTGLINSYIALNKARDRRPWRIFALAAITTVSIAPFTWIFMTPTNNELFRLGTQPQAIEMPQLKELLARWTWLHFVRSLFPLAGTIMSTVGTFY